MPPKKRGHDSDSDDAPTAKQVAPPSGGKKAGKKGADNDGDEAVTKLSKAAAKLRLNDDEDAGGGKGAKKGKGRRHDEEDDMPPTPAAEEKASGKAGKKGGKGRRGGDSDSEDEAPQSGKKAAGGAGKRKDKRGADSDDEHQHKGAAVGGRQSRRKGDDSDDSDKDDDASDDDRPRGKKGAPAKETPAKQSSAPDTKKKGKDKKGKKGRGDSDDDDDDVDGLLGMPAPGAGKGSKLKAAKLDSDDEVAPKLSKKGKKGGKPKRMDEESEDEAAQQAPAEEAEEQLAPEPAPEPSPAVAVESPPASKGSAKKKDKKRLQAAGDDIDGYGAEAASEAAASEVAVESTPTASTADVPAPAPAETAAEAEEDIALEFASKKKKKKKVVQVAEGEDGEEAVAAAPAPAAEETPAVDAAPEKKKKSKKSAAAAPETGHTGAAAAMHTSTSHHEAEDGVEEFYGEAEMGVRSSAGADAGPGHYTGSNALGDPVGLDGEPVLRDVAAALLKQSRGESLSNKERRLLKTYEEDRATRAPLRAGGTLLAHGDEMGIANFSLSQAGKAGGGAGAEGAAAENAKDIIIDNFTISAYKKELFANAQLRIMHGQRYGLLGPNGQGKTTLLKHIAARELAIPGRIDILYVEQEVVADDTAAIQAVLRADKKRAALMEEERQILEDLDAADAAEASGTRVGWLSDAERTKREERLNHVYEELASMKAEASEAQARKILAGLGFSPEMQERPTKRFSGGWRMRISLARALFMHPDLLLLDEPTNHLDLNAVIWLEDYLSRWKNTLLVVSHDQDFLSTVVTDIVHLEDRKLWYYKGDYDDFKEMHAQKLLKQAKDYEKQQKMLKSLKEKGKSTKQADDIAKSRAKREAAAGKKKDKASGGAGAGGHDDADSNALGEELITRPREYTVNFSFTDPPELAPPVLSVRRVSFRYGPKYPWLFRDVDFGIDQTSRVAIVGPNGAGKSTLLNLMIGDLEPTEGDVFRNRFLRVGKYSQHFVDVLPMEKSPVEYLQSHFGDLTYQAARNLLGKFGLEGHAHTIQARDLSGGQKARVVFAYLSLLAPHILVLDEPTNNLDIESIDALGEAIREFKGGVVLVSHDARLIRQAECQLWVCDNQRVEPYDGDVEDYRQSLIKGIHEEELRMDQLMAKAQAEEEERRMAAARERARRLKALREQQKAGAAAAAAT